MFRLLGELRSGVRALLWSSGLRREEFVRRLLESPKYQDELNLNRFEHSTFSQGGEDGILTEIFRRVGSTTKSFAEIGSGDGRENNTTALLTLGWTGLWVDCDRRSVARARSALGTLVEKGALEIRRLAVTAENVDSILPTAGELDLLSIDVDGNDYWIWKAVESVRPRVIVIEYNAHYGPGVHWVMAYERKHRWDGTTYFGASLSSLERLGREKGYRLVGCTLSGANAFFVREDLAQKRFQEPSTAERHWEPLRHALMARVGHPRSIGPFEIR